jgi:hypothetical protein
MNTKGCSTTAGGFSVTVVGDFFDSSRKVTLSTAFKKRSKVIGFSK